MLCGKAPASHGVTRFMVNIERRGACRNLDGLLWRFFFGILGAYKNVEDVLMLLVRRKGGG